MVGEQHQSPSRGEREKEKHCDLSGEQNPSPRELRRRSSGYTRLKGKRRPDNDQNQAPLVKENVFTEWRRAFKMKKKQHRY